MRSAVPWRWRMDPAWCRRSTPTSRSGRPRCPAPSSANAFQFTGRENDGTGLNAYRARFHNPILQRFVSEDPLELAGGDVNLFVYVGNQPTVWRDPWGLKPSPGFGSPPGQGPGPLGRRGDPRGPRGPGDPQPEPRDSDERDRCQPFGRRWRQNVDNTNNLPGILAPGGLAGGLRAVETVGQYVGVPAPSPVGVFSAPATSPGLVRTVAARGGAFLLVGMAWEVGVGVGSAIDAGILDPCAGF